MTQLFWYPGYDLSMPEMVRSEKAWVFDKTGKRYVDMGSGVWCTILGHSHPEVTAVLASQAGTLGHCGFNYGSSVVEAAAGRVLELHGFAGGKAVFLCSGSEAVEFMVRVAQETMGAPKFLTMADSYFGAYGAAKLQTGNWERLDWAPCKACTNDCTLSCEHLSSISLDEIGAFLFEPGSASGRVGFPPQKLIHTLVEAVKSRGGLVLVNEVTTGMGRTGQWFGYTHYGIQPDMVAMGKGLGNGYPVSAAAVCKDVADQLPQGTIAYSQSHQNDAAGAAVAMAVIDALAAEDLVNRAAAVSEPLLAGLEKIRQSTGKIREIRARGLMMAVEMYLTPEETARVRAQLLSEGFLAAQRPGLSILRLDPPLVLEREDIEGFIRAFQQSLEYV